MKSSQEGNSSSKVETMNEYQQEAEVTKSQGRRKALQEISAEATISKGLCKALPESPETSDTELLNTDGICDEEISDTAGQSNLDATTQSPKKGRFEQALKEVNLNRYRDLYLAAVKGNWKDAEKIIYKNPVALTAKISMLSKTVLHVAAYSCNDEFVKNLVEMMTPEQVPAVDLHGITALHYAASTAVVDVAKALLNKNPGLTEVQGYQGFIPLLSAVVHGAAKGKEMVRFLASETENPFLEATSAHLLLELTHAGFHDITLDLLHRFPQMATVTINESKSSILGILAVRPMDFRSGTRLNFWETWIYQLAPCQSLSGAKGDVEDPSENSNDPKDPNTQAWAARVCKWFKRHIWKIITNLAPSTCQKFLDLKCRHKYALKLVTFICERAKEMPNEDILSYFVHKKILNRAAKSGIVEIIKVCVHHFPDIISIWSDGTKSWNRTESWKTVLDVAVEHRRESVFNLLHAMSELCTVFGEPRNDPSAKRDDREASYEPFRHCSIMHLVAQLAPSRQLSSISGTALQMQRELQWYKEVEKLAHPSEKEKKDLDGCTPRELFTKEHRELVEKAEKWMKDTSNSCMVVTTLVATVVFAAAFTVPGGNNSQGIPIFLEHKPFTVFIISDALALFSALTSVLMFLSILTSRYAEEDFLKKLPIKLLLGLVSLFFAIATMMIAFVAALWIVLDDKFKWVFIPVTILASIPVTVFLSLQLPLCFQIYKSTFIGIFHPENIW